MASGNQTVKFQQNQTLGWRWPRQGHRWISMATSTTNIMECKAIYQYLITGKNKRERETDKHTDRQTEHGVPFLSIVVNESDLSSYRPESEWNKFHWDLQKLLLFDVIFFKD